MQAELPAQGISKRGDWGTAQSYRIDCECGQDWHSHNLWVEADHAEVNVNIEVTLKSDFWTEAVTPSYSIDNPWLQELHWFVVGVVNGLARRVRGTYQLWLHGALEQSTVITMGPQQALNYAETLTRAVGDVITAQEKAQ